MCDKSVLKWLKFSHLSGGVKTTHLGGSDPVPAGMAVSVSGHRMASGPVLGGITVRFSGQQVVLDPVPVEVDPTSVGFGWNETDPVAVIE